MLLARGHYEALAAATALIVIQVGTGIILKIAQTDGSYSFSTSGSVSISELGKLVLSAIFFHRECSRRIARGAAPGAHAGDEYEFLPLSSPEASDGHQEGDGQARYDENHISEHGKDSNATTRPKLGAVMLWSYFRREVSPERRSGFYILALCYALINNSVFLSYYLADPGTVQLSKTSGTLITAIIMVFTLKTAISRTQWAAVFLQMFGLVLTQYKPGAGSAYPASTYAILLFQVFISAASGVYNQHLLKTDQSSMHTDNMILYAFGAGINLLCHVCIFCSTAHEPNLFQGYNDIRAVLVVASHIFVGLAITSVYKYADAVVKCLATAVATGILLYISPIFFRSELGTFVSLGALIVFFASWLYMAYPPTKPDAHSTSESNGRSPPAPFKYGTASLGLLTIGTVGMVTSMAIFKARAPTNVDMRNENAPTNVENYNTTVSPFHNVVAMVRWNSVHPERIPSIMKYQPFFDAVHISMPDLAPEQPAEFYNMTHDQFQGTFVVYHQVAKIMQLALADKPETKGLMYFHFDAWLDPLAWGGTDWDKLWFSYGTPEHKCMTEPNDWWGWREGMHLAAMNASLAVQQLGLGYKVKPGEWCLGWSDIYYVPRRFFSDYILLADIFKQFDVFHEVAVPTIAHIISDSQRQPALDLVKDCWGACCDTVSSPDDVLKHRCGHRLDYLNTPVVDAFYAKLDSQAALLRSARETDEDG